MPKALRGDRRIRDELRLDGLSLEFWRAELLQGTPLAWLVEINGFVVDARMLPPDLQQEAHEPGLIPALRR